MKSILKTVSLEAEGAYKGTVIADAECFFLTPYYQPLVGLLTLVRKAGTGSEEWQPLIEGPRLLGISDPQFVRLPAKFILQWNVFLLHRNGQKSGPYPLVSPPASPEDVAKDLMAVLEATPFRGVYVERREGHTGASLVWRPL